MNPSDGGLLQNVNKDVRCIIYEGNKVTLTETIMSHLQLIASHSEEGIQSVVLTGSRERAFYLFTRISELYSDNTIVTHVGVGSLKYERDLKALHEGVDILIATPGRLNRMYQHNENCFTNVKLMLVDNAEVVFARAIEDRTLESLALFSYSRMEVYYDKNARNSKHLCTLEEICNKLITSVHLSISKSISLKDIVVEKEDSPISKSIRSQFYVLPDTASLAISKKLSFFYASLQHFTCDSSVQFIVLSSSSEYSINYLLRFLIENKLANTRILCISEMNSQSEIRSRIRFINETKIQKKCIVLVHDSLLPLLTCCNRFDTIIHLDLPLSYSIFASRVRLLHPSGLSLFFIPESQRSVLQLLHDKSHLLIEPWDYEMQRDDAEYLASSFRKRTGVTSEMGNEDNFDDMTEEEREDLFYINKSTTKVPESAEHSSFFEVNLKDMDFNELDNLDAPEKPDVCDVSPPYNQLPVGYASPIPMTPSNPVNSVFNPLTNWLPVYNSMNYVWYVPFQ